MITRLLKIIGIEIETITRAEYERRLNEGYYQCDTESHEVAQSAATHQSAKSHASVSRG